ncbi:hypothetical protein EDB86DRAFT_1841816 [Lactarius hatsudake]|nr:hypothetical protein EDB86DRAFT_1841816 [Lactarius hatsudake]
MSSTHTLDIRSLFEAALSEYEKRAGTNLIDNELSFKLKSCDSADSILAVIQDQAQAFQTYRGDNGKITRRLKQAVNVLHTVSTSAVFMEGIGIVPFPPAKAIFVGIGILLAAIKDVSASYDALIELFELIESFLTRLNIYTKVQSTPAMSEIVVKILVELLATLALATQQVKQGRLIKLGKKLLGEKDVEALLQKLDRLTREESQTTAALTLEVVYGLAQNLRDVMDNEKASGDSISQVLSSLQDLVSNEIKKNLDRSRKKSRKWLSPPDPSQNQNVACEVCYDGTATWFIQGTTFLEWRTRGSLLWIHGKPGSGKSVLCSTIIKGVESMQEAATCSMAFFYFDFRDDEKRNRRGLLTSLLVQFCARSDDCCDILSRLYSVHDDGLRQPNDRALLDCLKEMLTVGKLGETYIIVDALDECPTITGTPSAREKVLDLVTDLVNLKHPNLRLVRNQPP